ncbi:nuclear-pore anchor-like [Juglans microcarpa x Juglans regia]|uniref:nuclear-pore anchor-like n=1 Tax=Juglans microcarpa x Juglans regia TaxID=2249226 RepID=UPI001B7D9D5B|nr:nuclear-pore anchor-like [Juglans microcarpa x Juglans regia]
MPMFLSDEEFSQCAEDAAAVAEKADAFIAELYKEVETVRARADASAITAEQTCSLLEQKYLSLSAEFSKLESQNAQLQSSLDQRLSDLAQVQAQKHQLQLQSIGKDGQIERLTTEVSELHKSKRQLIELVEQKDLETGEKNATSKSYLDKIVKLSATAAQRESRLNEIEAELSRAQATLSRLSQEKELVERHNVWLNDELTEKVDSLNELRRKYNDIEADMSAKLAEVERQYNECSGSLQWNRERVRELETKLTSLQEELCSSKDAAAANEERLSAELSTLNKLVELYKESSGEWSKRAGELEGVVKALETHLIQVEIDYKERLEKEVSARNQFEKDAADLKAKLEKCEADVENSRKSNELNLLPHSNFSTEILMNSFETNCMVEDNHMVVPKIPAGVSGTALAASLLRDGWSLAKVYLKYQETVDALRHEQLGRKQSEVILQRVLYELEEKAEVILDERAEHERMAEAYSEINQKLQNLLSEQTNFEKTIQKLKADLRRHERDYTLAQKEIVDLQKQVTVLLKECQDIRLRCGSTGLESFDVGSTVTGTNAESDTEKVISERLLTFKDINGLVEQNVQLRSLLRSLSDQVESTEMEFKEKFEMELKNHTDESSSKVAAVLQRAEEQGRMIESLHTSVAMYKRLYEEERKLDSCLPHFSEAERDDGRTNLKLLLERSQEASTKAQEQAVERGRCLEEELVKSRTEIISLRTECDKFALEANFARERLDSFMKEFEHQRIESNGILARNVEFSQLIIDHQRKLRESSESLNAAEDLSRKLTMEVSVFKHEKDMLVSAEKRACNEVRGLSERVYHLQASLDTIQGAEEVHEEARTSERRKQEEHIKQVEREWAEAKKQLQEERDNVQNLRVDREQTIKDAMRQVEEMGKELTLALRAVAAAESRAVVAEVKLSDLERKIKSSDAKDVDIDGASESSSFLSTEIVAELRMAKEEIEKLKLEAQANKDHMQQYKSIAQVNEDALKQMESAHETFKIEANKLKKSLEDEVLSLRERVSELEYESSLKSEEVASITAEKEESLVSALAEIKNLKEESSVKTSQILAMEIQISVLKEDLEKEHQRWRGAQTNYERQVILLSETIQELTTTSETLASLQEEASELRKVADAHKSENNKLKSKWEVDKAMLEESKNEAEKKYNDTNEQNKILHSRLEALHIQLAEKDRNSVGVSSGSASCDTLGDAGLQNIINYLRRSKEIAETEISLLKQEKLQLQSQLERALKAIETAQASLQAEHANSRVSLFTEKEIKSLQLQVREMNLLRESNMQLREENKHNFEECLKLREGVQNAKVETQNLGSLLRERQIEVEACKKEIEMQKVNKDNLEKRVCELLERCKNIDVEDYDRMKDDIQRMQEKLKDKDAQIAEIRKLLSERQDTASKLEQDLSKRKLELSEREKRINENLQVEARSKLDAEKQRKMFIQLKRRFETLSKEKEELSKENQALSGQLEEVKQGKRSISDTGGEQATKEEKDTKIQTLEKHLERQREELRKEKERRLNAEKAQRDSYNKIEQDKTKFVNELEMHKQALKRLSDELRKLKHAKDSLPEGASVVQILSGTLLDDLAAPYVMAVENLEKVAHSVLGELGAHGVPTDTSSIADTSLTTAAGPIVSMQAPSLVFPLGPSTSVLPAKATEESEKRFTLAKTNVETRKAGRKLVLVRPRIVKSDEPQGDVEMSEVEGANSAGKPAPSSDTETQGNLTLLTQPLVRKRLASSSTSELHEETVIQGEISSDVGVPVLKKTKVSEPAQESSECQFAVPVENLETLVATEGLSEVHEFPQGPSEEVIDGEEEVETTGDKAEDKKSVPDENVDRQGGLLGYKKSVPDENVDRQGGLHGDKKSVLDENVDRQDGSDMVSDDGPKDQAEERKKKNLESGSEREEGELMPDFTDPEVGDISNTMGKSKIGEGQPEPIATPLASLARAGDETLVAAAMEIGEINSPEALNDEKNEEGDAEVETAEGSDKSNDGKEQIVVETAQVSEASYVPVENTSGGAVTEADVSKQGSPLSEQGISTVNTETDVVRQGSPVGLTSTTINLSERARQNAARRLGVVSSPVVRGRGRAVPRARGPRGGRGGYVGRGQSSNEQG